MPIGIYIRTDLHCKNISNALRNLKYSSRVEKIPIQCQYCRKIKYVYPSIAKTTKYCSLLCKYAAGHSEKAKKKMRNNNARRKNDNISYIGMHVWIARALGKASNYKCVDCNKQAKDWSNVDHSYKRKLNDYLPRCRKCHRIYDKKFNNSYN